MGYTGHRPSAGREGQALQYLGPPVYRRRKALLALQDPFLPRASMVVIPLEDTGIRADFFTPASRIRQKRPMPMARAVEEVHWARIWTR